MHADAREYRHMCGRRPPTGDLQSLRHARRLAGYGQGPYWYKHTIKVRARAVSAVRPKGGVGVKATSPFQPDKGSPAHPAALLAATCDPSIFSLRRPLHRGPVSSKVPYFPPRMYPQLGSMQRTAADCVGHARACWPARSQLGPHQRSQANSTIKGLQPR